jgi:hypothetical protein
VRVCVVASLAPRLLRASRSVSLAPGAKNNNDKLNTQPSSQLRKGALTGAHGAMADSHVAAWRMVGAHPHAAAPTLAAVRALLLRRRRSDGAEARSRWSASATLATASTPNGVVVDGGGHARASSATTDGSGDGGRDDDDELNVGELATVAAMARESFYRGPFELAWPPPPQPRVAEGDLAPTVASLVLPGSASLQEQQRWERAYGAFWAISGPHAPAREFCALFAPRAPFFV